MATKATQAAKKAVKKSPPEKKTAAKKTVAKTQAAKKTSVNSGLAEKDKSKSGDPSSVITKYYANLTRLADRRGHTIATELDNAIHDHLEKAGML